MTSRLPDDDQLYENWLWWAPLGLAMTGLGATLLNNAGGDKERQKLGVRTLARQIFALAFLLGGLTLFGNAIRDRAVSDALQYQKQ